MTNKRRTYEAFCHAMAGIYNKHARNGGNYFTCYVRESIEYYIIQNEVRRGVLMDTAGREALVGFKIAHALLKAGWDVDTILEYVDLQQSRVDEAERLVSFEEAVGALYEGRRNTGYVSYMNYLRYAWLMDGAPDLEGVCQEILEGQDDYDEDDYDEDDYDEDE